MPETNSYKRRSPDKKSQTFYLSKETIRKLDLLSKASRFTKTDLVDHWIQKEFEAQEKAGNLDIHSDPFPQPPKAGGVLRKFHKVKQPGRNR